MARRILTARDQVALLSPWRQASWFHPEIGIEEYPTLSRKQQKALYDEIVAQGGPRVLSNVYHSENWGSGDPGIYHHYVARGRDGTIHGVLTAFRDYKTMEPKRPHKYPSLDVHDVYTGADAPKGTGSALMQAAAHRAMRDGARFGVVGVVPHASGFYHALGGTRPVNWDHFKWSDEDRDALAMGTPNPKPVTPMRARVFQHQHPPFDTYLVDPVMPPGADDPVDFGEHFVPKELRQRRTVGSRRTAMPSRTVNVGTKGGLHSRPSAIITDAVLNANMSGNPGKVTLSMEGQPPVDASSMFNVMNLGATRGTPITVSSDNETLMHQIADIVAHDHDTDKSYHNRFPSLAYDQWYDE